MPETAWEPLGKLSPRELVPARLLLHHAAQLAAAVGRSLVPARPDDGHTSLEWTPSPRGLASQQVAGARPWRALLGLEEASPALVVLAEGAELGRIALEGRTTSTSARCCRSAAHRPRTPPRSASASRRGTRGSPSRTSM